MRPAALAAAAGHAQADLVVVGGGYTGLWTALPRPRAHPDRDVVLLEAGECGWQASGRNGGFVAASLTHGFGNGMDRWPDELATLDRLGVENLAGIGTTVEHHGLDCGFETDRRASVATRPHEVEELGEVHAAMTARGHDVACSTPRQPRALVASPTYLAGAPRPRTVPPWSSRPDLPGACGRRAWTPACGSSSSAP